MTAFWTNGLHGGGVDRVIAGRARRARWWATHSAHQECLALRFREQGRKTQPPSVVYEPRVPGTYVTSPGCSGMPDVLVVMLHSRVKLSAKNTSDRAESGFATAARAETHATSRVNRRSKHTGGNAVDEFA